MEHPRTAIAISYDPATGRLPEVTARGRGLVAERILAAARAAGVPVREDAGLAEVLKALEPGMAVPPAAFAALAAILAHLYRADRELAANGAAR